MVIVFLQLIQEGQLSKKKVWLGKLTAHDPSDDQEVTGSIPARSATFFLGVLIMKYFLQSFSPFG